MAVALVAAPGQAQVVNGGFETGDLSGWTSTLSFFGTTQATTGLSGFVPVEGSFYAAIQGGDDHPAKTFLEQTFTAPGGSLEIQNYYDNNSTVSFFDDEGFCDLDGTVYFGPHSQGTVGLGGDTGWVPSSLPLTAGDHTIRCGHGALPGFPFADGFVGMDDVRLSGGGDGSCDLSPIEAKLDILEPKLDEHDTVMEAKADSIEAKADSLEAKADSLEAKLDALDAKLDTVVGELGVNLCGVYRLLNTPQGRRCVTATPFDETCSFSWNSVSTGGSSDDPVAGECLVP